MIIVIKWKKKENNREKSFWERVVSIIGGELCFMRK